LIIRKSGKSYYIEKIDYEIELKKIVREIENFRK